MQFDRPPFFCTDTKLIDLHGSNFIDQPTLDFFRSLYPRPPPTFTDVIKTTKPSVDINATGWQFFKTTASANPIFGLVMIDMNKNDNFRLNTGVRNFQSGGYDAYMDTWGPTTLYGAAGNVLSFGPTDTRIRTGRLDWRTPDIAKAVAPGRPEEKYVEFKPPFERTPTVVPFIAYIDVDKDHHVRVKAEIPKVDKNGFTILFGTWAGKFTSLVVPLRGLTELRYHYMGRRSVLACP
jgi:H-type lectin domain